MGVFLNLPFQMFKCDTVCAPGQKSVIILSVIGFTFELQKSVVCFLWFHSLRVELHCDGPGI